MQAMANMSGSERETLVDRIELLRVLKENREKHRQQHEAAVSGYVDSARSTLEKEHAKALKEVEDAFEKASERLKEFDPEKTDDNFVICRPISFRMPVPRSHDDAYEQAIQMINWDTREAVTLTATEFRSFVMNIWDWTEEFAVTSSRYL